MQAPRLVATDVDGTLLDPFERVPPRTVAVVGRLAAAGVGFVLATGRPPRWIPPVVEQFDDPGVVRMAVCANGGVLYDPVADRVLGARTLDPDTLATLAGVASEALPGCGIAVERVSVGAPGGGQVPFLAEPDYQHAWADADNDIAPRGELLGEPAVKLLVRCPQLSSDAMVAVLAPLLAGLADVTFSHPSGLVELSSPGVSKATGLAEVAAGMGVDPADVVAFGDMPNDLEMLRWAGHGVAMGNAHPALIEVADEVTAGHGEEGVALVLERWF